MFQRLMSESSQHIGARSYMEKRASGLQCTQQHRLSYQSMMIIALPPAREDEITGKQYATDYQYLAQMTSKVMDYIHARAKFARRRVSLN